MHAAASQRTKEIAVLSGFGGKTMGGQTLSYPSINS